MTNLYIFFKFNGHPLPDIKIVVVYFKSDICMPSFQFKPHTETCKNDFGIELELFIKDNTEYRVTK